VLFRPALVERREDVQKAEVLILLDDSASMRRKDAYSGDEAGRKAAEALSGKSAAQTMRLELVQALLSKEMLPHMRARGYVPRAFRFAEGLSPFALSPTAVDEAADTLEGHGATTQLGDALQAVIAAHRGRHVTDVLVISDGRSNAGVAPLDYDYRYVIVLCKPASVTFGYADLN
jgi:hypothetical protein